MADPERFLFALLWASVALVAAVGSHYYLFLRQDLTLRQTILFGLVGLGVGVMLSFIPYVRLVAPVLSIAPGLLYVIARQRSWVAADRVYLERKLAEVQAELKLSPRNNQWHCEAAKLCSELGDMAQALYHAAVAVEVAQGELQNSRAHACMYGVTRLAQRQGRVRCEVCKAHIRLGTRICPHCHADRTRNPRAGDVIIFGAPESYAQGGIP